MRILRLAALGAAAAYFFNREHGSRRRSMVLERLRGLAGGGSRDTSSGETSSFAQGPAHPGDHSRPER